jgi:hypothetical protein
VHGLAILIAVPSVLAQSGAAMQMQYLPFEPGSQLESLCSGLNVRNFSSRQKQPVG